MAQSLLPVHEGACDIRVEPQFLGRNAGIPPVGAWACSPRIRRENATLPLQRA